MQVKLNGEARELPEAMTILQLLEWLKVRRDTVAVEVNREIIPRARHGDRRLEEDDVVEVVTFVGGG
jgi:sulfur carrier protein